MKKNPGYECILIINNNNNDEALEEVIKKFSDLITNSDGKISYSEAWGRKKLSYQIDKCAHGYYHLFYFTGNGALVKDLNLQSSYSDDVLRCFICSVDDMDESYNEFVELKNDPEKNLLKFQDVLNKGAQS